MNKYCIFTDHLQSYNKKNIRGLNPVQKELILQRVQLTHAELYSEGNHICQYHYDQYLRRWHQWNKNDTCIKCNNMYNGSLRKASKDIIELYNGNMDSKIHTRPCYEEYLNEHPLKKRKVSNEYVYEYSPIDILMEYIWCVYVYIDT